MIRHVQRVEAPRDSTVEVYRSDEQAKREFFAAMKRFVRVVNTKEYQKIEHIYGTNWGGVASCAFTINHDFSSGFILTKKTVENVVIAINKDKIPSKKLIDAAIHHEISEIWVYARIHNSPSLKVYSGKISATTARKIAHEEAVIETYRLAQSMGILNELRAWELSVHSPEEAAQAKILLTQALNQV